MKLAVVQFQPVLGDVEHNIEHIIGLLRAANGDVVIFPELSTSGYLFTSRESVKAVALERTSAELLRLAEAANAEKKVTVVGFPELDGSKLYNSAVLYAPGMEPFYYRKTHLFYRERFCFDEGDTGFGVFPIYHLDVNIGIMICYDWRFPEAARTLALRGADLIVCPSNLVTTIWRIAMPVRALENKVYVAVANRIGTEVQEDETLCFNGYSAIYSYNGEVLTSLEGEEEGIAIAEIDPSLTRKKSFNPYNDIIADRRQWAYQL